MSGEPQERVLLRAVLTGPTHAFVANAVELTETTAFISTKERPEVGWRCALELSFRTLVPTIHVGAEVIERVDALEPGDPSGLRVRFDADDPAAIEPIRRLLARFAADAPPSPGSVFRVLLVEDSTLVSEMFSYGVERYFKNRKARVSIDVATTAADAWGRLETSAYDLAIIDHFLPTDDGASLVAKVRADPRIGTLLLVGVSKGGPEVRASMLEAGVDLFIDKPVLLNDLLVTMDRLAARPAEGILRHEQ